MESVWNIMSKFKFVVNDENNEDLKCVMCKKLAIDAVLSAICGCIYCYCCVASNTRNGDVFCPGNKQFCKDDHIAIDKNAFRNSFINKRILKLNVNCPNGSCDFNLELTEMKEHLRICMKQPVECPFGDVGCDSNIRNGESLVNHLHDNVLPHSEILIDLIQNLRNEVNGLRDNLWKTKSKLGALKEEWKNKDVICEELVTQIREVEKTVNVQRRELGCLLTVVEDLKNKLKDKENRIMTLEKQFREVTNEMEIKLKREMKEYVEEQSRLREDTWIKKEMTLMDDMRKRNDEMNNARMIYDEDRNRKINNMIKLCPNMDVDFIYRINQFSKKIDVNIFSESFYSNNYKLCLFVRIYSNDDIALLCVIKKGGDKVKWPMKHSVTLSIIDQCTLRTFKTKTYNYDTYERDKSAFDRPKSEKNGYGIGSSSFIKYSSIKDNSSIIANDSMIVSCVLGYP